MILLLRKILLKQLISEKDNNSISNVVNLAYPRNKNYGSDFKEVSYDNFTENVSMNLGGYFLVLKVFAQKLAKKRRKYNKPKFYIWFFYTSL